MPSPSFFFNEAPPQPASLTALLVTRGIRSPVEAELHD
jgi:hypothetical protein